MDWSQRIENYERATGKPRSLFLSGTEQVVGTWLMGNAYGEEGDYPAGYVRRVRSLFPDKQRVLHVYSDGRDDLPGEFARTLRGLNAKPIENFDLVLCDPPYSRESANLRGDPKVQRQKTLNALAERLPEGARVLWLDQILPHYRKNQLEVEGNVGVVKSANHRFRVLTIFRKI
jgi:hypothetical protein